LSAANNEILSSSREYASIADVPEVRGSEEVEDDDNDGEKGPATPLSFARRSTVVEVGREADGYMSDSEDSDDEPLFVPRSASEVQLNSSSQ
jgi:hypothetical protein